MFSQAEAKISLEKFYPEATVKSWTQYRDIYLFQVEHPSVEEKDYDPFFSVDPFTEEIRDFSVITDGDISEIMKLEWKEV